MKFDATAIDGVVLITPDKFSDERGFFSRIFCAQEFASAGIAFDVPQMNLSRNIRALTLRGMHYQEPPFAEAKLVHVTHGKIYDVVIDLRRSSRSYQSWFGVTLDSEVNQALFIPEGCAHGFLTLEPKTDVLYQMGRAYVHGHAKGVRYDDPIFAIAWPAPPVTISEADLAWPSWQSG
jgi:dTDP-4-dehydrorhamnose 3,5-epimerase